jgi:hypothetical protein
VIEENTSKLIKNAIQIDGIQVKFFNNMSKFFFTITVVIPKIRKKMPNNSSNISGILGRIVVKFNFFWAFFMNNLKTFRHCYKNTVILGHSYIAFTNS